MRIFENYHKVYPYIEALNDNAPDHETRWMISDLLSFLEDYLNITTNQYIRVKKKLEYLSGGVEKSTSLHQELNIMFGDVHFMFIAIGKAYSISLQLLKKLERPDLVFAITTSEHYKTMKFFRNNLEHMDEKLTKQNDGNEKEWYSQNTRSHWFSRQWGVMNGTKISLGNYAFSIEEKSISPLWEIYDQIFEIIEKKYIDPDKEKIDRIFKNHRLL